MTKLKVSKEDLESIIGLLPDLTDTQLDRLHDEIFAEYHERNQEPWDNVLVEDEEEFEEGEEDDNTFDGSL